jgi:hypothetical protein
MRTKSKTIGADGRAGYQKEAFFQSIRVKAFGHFPHPFVEAEGGEEISFSSMIRI